MPIPKSSCAHGVVYWDNWLLCGLAHKITFKRVNTGATYMGITKVKVTGYNRVASKGYGLQNCK